MLCPQCKSKTDVYDTRMQDGGDVRRRRACISCGFRFATIETLNLDQPLGKKQKREPAAPKPPRVKRVTTRDTRATRKKIDEEELGSVYDEDFEEVAPLLDIPRGLNDF